MLDLLILMIGSIIVDTHKKYYLFQIKEILKGMTLVVKIFRIVHTVYSKYIVPNVKKVINFV